MPRTIVVIGGFVTDLVTVAHRVPDSGETIVSDSFSQHPGGKGANSAVACYRLSHTKPAPINDARSNTATLSSQPAVAGPMQSAASPRGATTALEGVSAKHVPNLPTVVNGIPHDENPFAMSRSNTELPTAGIVDGVAEPQDDQREHGAVDEGDIRVRMTGALGDDSFAPSLRQVMKNNGVDISRVRSVKDKPTGVGVVLVETMYQENRILFNPGANHDLQPAEFETLDSLNGGCDGGTPSKPDLLISQMELRKETVVQVLRTASENGVTTLLNPAPAFALELAIYKMVSHLVVNETEAAMLADTDVANITDETGYGHVTDVFLRKGVPNVVVTLGPKGAYYSTELGKGGLVAAEQVTNVIDTTGAGDTFVGAYGVEVVRQMASGMPFDIRKAVQFACKASARVIQKIGCLEPIPWLDEVEYSSAGQEV